MVDSEIVSLEVDLEERERMLAQAHRLASQEIEAVARCHGEARST
jgi:hypothetical protein